MKNKLIFVPLITILILGLLILEKTMIIGVDSKELNVSAKVVNKSYDLRVIKAVNELRRGETGTITIQGRPGITYSIVAYYSLGKEFIEGKQERTSDEFGQATFFWKVSKNTVPGIYLVEIMGDGKKIHLYHTVME